MYCCNLSIYNLDRVGLRGEFTVGSLQLCSLQFLVKYRLWRFL